MSRGRGLLKKGVSKEMRVLELLGTRRAWATSVIDG